MFDPTFMRQVSLAVHGDRVTARGQADRVRSAAFRRSILRALGLTRRVTAGSPVPPACAESPTLAAH